MTRLWPRNLLARLGLMLVLAAALVSAALTFMPDQLLITWAFNTNALGALLKAPYVIMALGGSGLILFTAGLLWSRQRRS
ncbi:hypothetical protein Q0812_12270 [Brevundimonas sp. 2R-24]|uniref:Uncharacterized protein n=1 Tax=Peiella sedimenti TaxID=3061083 RepID=A0ABT8SNT7_9CAUL|nr:hypothetical protein [Caulobacteraceae bacterium XZ-24]